MAVTFANVLIITIGLSLTTNQVRGRAANISNTWFLPQEGFPVFYRYFNTKVTWNEAEAVCGFHHADLLSVQTSAQMDAARAYLKEIDVIDNIWIGLQRESSEKPFSWTNGEKLLGDGYWLEPIPKTNEKLCAAIDPVSDFRWNNFYCRGPQVASFICELPVPEWAKKEDGCMITLLPSLTITYMPEMGIVQLFSDCGLDGTRRIACKGGVNRDEIIKRLSCDEDAFASTTLTKLTTDAVRLSSTQQGTSAANDVKPATRTGEGGQVQKKSSAYLPQTRHKRDLNESSDGGKPGNTSPEPSVPMVTSTQDANVLKAPPQHVFPHSPHSPSERNSVSTTTTTTTTGKDQPTTSNVKDEKPPQTTTNKVEGVVSPPLNKSLPPALLPRISKTHDGSEVAATTSTTTTTTTTTTTSTTMPTATTTQTAGPGGTTDTSSSKKETGSVTQPAPVPATSNEVPVLIITSESLNDSAAANSTSTSENPQIVFMIDEKEGFAEPYLVPMNEDIVINNPSLSPMEVIDVDLIEIDNLTTAKSSVGGDATTTPSTTTTMSATSKAPHGVHPMRLGEKTVQAHNGTTTTTTTTTTTAPPTSSTGPTSSGKPTESTTVTPTAEDLTKQMDEADGDGMDVPQRPNRGRLLTHSNHPSFYPYFLNRVLG